MFTECDWAFFVRQYAEDMRAQDMRVQETESEEGAP